MSDDSERAKAGAGRPEVSWKTIEEGAQVFSAEGVDVGTVSRIVGDANVDVFTGLAIRLRAFGRERFFASEAVRGIWPDRVDLTLTEAEVKALPVHEDPPAVRVRPGTRGFFGRIFRR